MGLFKLIEERRYAEFCEIYLKHVNQRASSSEFSDLMPGNYILALIGLQNYEELVRFSLEQIELKKKESIKYDMRTSNNYIALSVGYMGMQCMKFVIQAIKEGLDANYQDLARTQTPCIMYYEAVVLGDIKAKQESKKVLNSRLRNKQSFTVEYATARFLLNKCLENDMLQQIDSVENTILKYRYKVQALFYMAVHAFEVADYNLHKQYLNQASKLYDECPSVTVQIEYHLAVNWLSQQSDC